MQCKREFDGSLTLTFVVKFIEQVIALVFADGRAVKRNASLREGFQHEPDVCIIPVLRSLYAVLIFPDDGVLGAQISHQ